MTVPDDGAGFPTASHGQEPTKEGEFPAYTWGLETVFLVVKTVGNACEVVPLMMASTNGAKKGLLSRNKV